MALQFPYAIAPAQGEVIEVADGVLWARLPLPYQLDHVNVFVLRDEPGWTVVDTGINTAEAMTAWDRLIGGPLAGLPITRVLVTHHHPDHIGLAGWLCRRFGAELLTSQSAYMTSRVISAAPHEDWAKHRFDFYTRHGMSKELAGVVTIQGNDYLTRVADLPLTFLRVVHSDRLSIGKREFRVIATNGHAPEQIMLYCQDDHLLLAADQLIERISPNISVFAGEPNGDPLGHFLRSLRRIREELPEDTLVLSGHRLPFYGLRIRCAELEAHHQARCATLRAACLASPRSVADLVPLIFTRDLDPHQMSFAFTETLAHVNRLVRRCELHRLSDGGTLLYSASSKP